MSERNPCNNEVEEEGELHRDQQSLTLVHVTNLVRSLKDFLLSQNDVFESVLNSYTAIGKYLE